MDKIADVDWGTVNVLIAIIGAAFTAVVFIIVKVFNLGKVAHRLKTVEDTTKEIKKDLKDLGQSLTKRIDEILNFQARKGLAESNSPMELSQKGRQVLKDSGMDAVVNDKFDIIVERVRKLKPKNPYQAEQAVFGVVADLDNDPTIKDAIEEGAFKSGYLKGSVLFVGGLYIRNRVLKELDFNIDDIDKHKPVTEKS